MKIERFTWPADVGTVSLGGPYVMDNENWETGHKQPELGLTVGWNRPQAAWWQPYVVLNLGVWSIQFGWLYD